MKALPEPAILLVHRIIFFTFQEVEDETKFNSSGRFTWGDATVRKVFVDAVGAKLFSESFAEAEEVLRAGLRRELIAATVGEDDFLS